MWCPPTPPQDNNDIYIDYSLTFMYETSVIRQSELPPVYVRKDFKRSRNEAGLNMDGSRRVPKLRREDTVFAPRSLFDRPSAVMARIRRDLKNQRYHGVFKPNVQIPGLRPQVLLKPLTEQDSVTEWSVFEDIAILHVLVDLQGLPCNLMVLSPGHTPNWDLVAEIVNHYSKSYRSPKQCRMRFETVIQPREEGKLIESPKKQKKLKTAIKCEYLKGPLRYLRTTQMYVNDSNGAFTKMMRARFDGIKTVYLKKAPPPKRQFGVPSLMNPKHMEVLQEFGIGNYDQPISPLNVALMKANKLREKQRVQLQPTTMMSAQQTPVQQQVHELLTNFNQQQAVSVSASLQQQQSAATAIVLHHAAASLTSSSTGQQTQLLRTSGANTSAQIVKAVVVPQGNTLQQLSQQHVQLQQAATNTPTAPVSVVLTSTVPTVSTSGQHHATQGSASATQIVALSPQTIVSNSSTLGSGVSMVQTLPSQTLPQVVSVSQLATVGTVLTTSASLQSNSNLTALRGQRIVTATAGSLQDVVLQQRSGTTGTPTIVSMSSIGQNVTQSQFQTTQLRLTSLPSGTQQVVTKAIPVSSLQHGAKLTTAVAGSAGGQQPAHIHFYRQRQQLKVLPSGSQAPGQAVQTQISSAQATTLVNNSVGGPGGNSSVIHGSLIATPHSMSGTTTMQVQGQKVSVTTIPTSSNIAAQASGNGITTVQVAHNQGRPQFIKQVAAGSKQTVTRQFNESDMLLVKRQVISSHQKAQLLQQGQLFTSANVGNSSGLQLQQPSSSSNVSGQALQQITAVVKTTGASVATNVCGGGITVSTSTGGSGQQLSTLSHLKPNQIKVTMTNQAQMRQLHMQQQLGMPRKISRMTQITASPSNLGGATSTVITPSLQLNAQTTSLASSSGTINSQTKTVSGSGASTGVQAQLVHIQNNKSLPNSVTVQQIQQVMRQNQTGTLSATGLVFGKTSVGRVIPVSVASQTNQRQTFQVVSAASAQALASSGLRAHVTSGQNITGTIKVTAAGAVSVNSGCGGANNGGQTHPQQTLITAIQQQAVGQQSQRQNASPVRLQATSSGNLVAVVQQQAISQNITSVGQSNTTICNTANMSSLSTATEVLTIASQSSAITTVAGTVVTNAGATQQQYQSPITTDPSSSTTAVVTTQQVRTLVKKKIMQIRNDAQKE